MNRFEDRVVMAMAHDIVLLRLIIDKIAEDLDLVLDGDLLWYAHGEYSVVHSFTPEELERLHGLVPVKP